MPPAVKKQVRRKKSMEKTKEELEAEEVAKQKLAAEAAKKEEAEKEGFAKEDEKVDANKFNQALRKAREAEAEKRELEKEKKRLEELVKAASSTDPKTSEKEEEGEENEEDDFWGVSKKKTVAQPKNDIDQEKIKAIISEQIKPFVEAETERKKIEKRNARQVFYDKHPEYLKDGNKWAELLEELNASIVPSGDYYQDLEKAHRIISGTDFTRVQIEQKKKEFASDAGTGSGGAGAPQPKNSGAYVLTAIDKKIMESMGVSEETIRKMRQEQKEGRLSLEF